MEIKKTQIDDLNLVLDLNIAKEDYADKKKKILNDYKRKSELKGFRKGMAPMSLIEKIYGNSALMDTVNNVISESLSNYIKENNLHVLGEPLPSEDQPKNDWTDGNDFNFVFDVALAPQLDFTLSKDDEIVYYEIEISEEAKKEMKENLLKQYGSLEDGEAAGEDDFLIVDFEQGETRIEGTYVALRNISEESRPKFVGITPDTVLDIDVNAAFPNETDRASMLKVKKEELEGMDPMWKMTVKSVKTFKSAELNQATYDKIFGEGTVSSEEEFDARVAERLTAEYAQESEFRFSTDARKYLMDKANVQLPEKFLKRWLIVANEGKFTVEDIEKDFDGFLEDFRWQTIKDYLAEKYQVKVTNEDMLSSAKSFAAYQFALYGMNNVPEEHLESYAKSILEQENESRRVYDQVAQQKVLNAVRAEVTLKNEKVTVDQFRAL